MTANEKLREMLDRRGIGYTKRASEVIDYECEGVTYRAFGIDGGIRIKNITPISPSTAVDMTLGRETCHMVLKDDHEEYGEAFFVWWECDECGFTTPYTLDMKEIHYCPNCGRRVVE